jgi:hypothetical protein
LNWANNSTLSATVTSINFNIHGINLKGELIALFEALYNFNYVLNLFKISITEISIEIIEIRLLIIKNKGKKV